MKERRIGGGAATVFAALVLGVGAGVATGGCGEDRGEIGGGGTTGGTVGTSGSAETTTTPTGTTDSP